MIYKLASDYQYNSRLELDMPHLCTYIINMYVYTYCSSSSVHVNPNILQHLTLKNEPIKVL